MTHSKLIILFSMAVVSVLSAGCAAPGPLMSTVRGSIPALRDGNSRLYVYRNSVVGAAVQPNVVMNGKVIGTARPNVVTFIDVTPGTYKIECTTEKTNDVTFQVAAGETKYIQLVPYLGFFMGHMDPQVVPEEKGEDDIRSLALVIAPQMKSRVPASLLPSADH